MNKTNMIQYMKIHLSSVLKREILDKGKSINAVARDCKIPVGVLHSWLNGVLPSAKNLHHIQSLSDHLGLSFEMLLFNKKTKEKSVILFSSEFVDGSSRYKILIEKMEDKK